MGKKNKANALGRALIKDRFGHNNVKRTVDNDSMLHTTEIQDGYDWGRLNLQSVTEESSFQDFFRTAELAGTEFQAEKLNITFVNPKSSVGLLSGTEISGLQQKHIDKKDLLKIPRRPKWAEGITAEELQKAENESFLEWRRGLAILQEEEGLLLTPYEKNLEFWRQLWRVVERSDVIVQIVDARNPLLFRSEDLERYVKEINPNKMNMILINKADFLTEKQRIAWSEYFDNEGIKVAFFSATLAAEELKKIPEEEDDDDDKFKEINDEINLDEIKAIAEELSKSLDRTEKQLEEIEKKIGTFGKQQEINKNDPKVLTREELIKLFKTIHVKTKFTQGVTTIGLVGYPNVGKSSTINSLMGERKVSVSATPGKTKHFQTLYLDSDVLLCDCPGLVMPSFVLTKADMILNGILPIDQMRDHVPPVNLLCTQIPKHILEEKYGVIIAKPMEGEDPNRAPHSEELLLAYGFNRGFMTANGQPDQSRSARYILKDYVNGKLLYCHTPPTIPQEEFHVFPSRVKREINEQSLPKTQQRAMRIQRGTSSKDVDQQFFQSHNNAAHVKGKSNFPHLRNSSGNSSASNSSVSGSIQSLNSTQFSIEKPWRHAKKEKKEKLRRKFAHLDQH